ARFEVHFHGGQRAPVVGTHQQRRRQFVSHIGFVGQLDQIPFAGRLVEGEFAPVVDQHSECGRCLVEPRLPDFSQRHGQSRQFDTVIVQKPPSPLRRREGCPSARKGSYPGSQIVRRTHVRIQQNQKSFLQRPAQRR